MRKFNYTLCFLLMMIALISIQCKKDEIDVFGQEKYIFIDNENINDNAINFSFAYDPTQDTKTLKIPVKYIGRFLEKDLDYSIAVENDSTTAKVENYTIVDKQTFRKDLTTDTMLVTLNKTADLDTKELRLRVKLVSNENFFATQRDQTYIDIYFSNIMSKPNWWTEDINMAFLGDYSEKKYLLFFNVTGISDFGELTPDQQQNTARKFKYYLQEQKANGNTILEENGSEMTVTVIG